MRIARKKNNPFRRRVTGLSPSPTEEPSVHVESSSWSVSDTRDRFWEPSIDFSRSTNLSLRSARIVFWSPMCVPWCRGSVFLLFPFFGVSNKDMIETTKPRNHETTKPGNHETQKQLEDSNVRGLCFSSNPRKKGARHMFFIFDMHIKGSLLSCSPSWACQRTLVRELGAEIQAACVGCFLDLAHILPDG